MGGRSIPDHYPSFRIVSSGDTILNSSELGMVSPELWHLVSPSRRYLLGKVIAASFNPFDVAFTVIGPGRPERPLTITWQRPL